MEKKIKHMEMIQTIINRMAANSFALKGWAVTLVAGIFALSDKDANKMYLLITYIPIIIFWGLDAYYLLQERRYRTLYDKVRQAKKNDVSFSMDISAIEVKTKKNTFWSCIKSPTELWFYFPLAILTAVIIIIICA